MRTLILTGDHRDLRQLHPASAIDRGFRCITARDAGASVYPDLHDAALRMIEVEGGVFGIVCTADEIAARLAAG